MDMNYFMHCGARLHPRFLEGEGEVPYCERCGEYRFPVFSTAVSMIVLDEAREHVLLIRQYGRPQYILTAGYVNRGEDAEAAAAREIQEELGLAVRSLRFNRSCYFAPSNTLMLNFAAVVPYEAPHPNREIDDWRWFTLAEALNNIKPNSLAEAFLRGYADALKTA